MSNIELKKNKYAKKALSTDLLPDYMDVEESYIEEKIVKTKTKSISITIKRLVWNTNIGEEVGKAKCMCCNVTYITQMSFNCGHIIAKANGGKTIVSNLKPICKNCNSSMKTKNMYEFMKTLK
jgi:5-methylcytosine-specific restriction endonuclease McrA